MKLPLGLIISLAICLNSGFLQAQTDVDTIMVRTSGLAVLLDIGKANSFIADYENKFEAGLHYMMKNGLAVVVEGGSGTLTPNNAFENANYESSGFYGRIGLDYHMHIDATSKFIFGLRYGQSSFDDNFNFIVGSEFWQGFEDSDMRTELDASWFEIGISTETQILRESTTQFYLGWHLRWRYLIEYTEFEPVDVYSIPGYGRTVDNSVPAVNLYLKYVIPFSSQ
ncbi:MAG: DUF6048 family protein [Bacteroidota bacterium]